MRSSTGVAVLCVHFMFLLLFRSTRTAHTVNSFFRSPASGGLTERPRARRPITHGGVISCVAVAAVLLARAAVVQ